MLFLYLTVLLYFIDLEMVYESFKKCLVAY